MIPAILKKLVEKQLGNVHRTQSETIRDALAELEILPNSEFGEFFMTYKVTLYKGSVFRTELCDISEPSRDIALTTRFIHEAWELPTNFICFSSVEGEGGYLYDKNTGKVWDFSLATRQDFIDGKEKPRWNSFFEFMIWYLS
jgi:hypothetical protein